MSCLMVRSPKKSIPIFVNGGLLIASHASGELLIIGNWGVSRRRLQKLQICMTFHTNALPLMLMLYPNTFS